MLTKEIFNNQPGPEYWAMVQSDPYIDENGSEAIDMNLSLILEDDFDQFDFVKWPTDNQILPTVKLKK